MGGGRDEKEIELAAAEHAHISRVTVYEDRCEVTRTLSVQLPKGKVRVKVVGITKKADRDSVFVRGSGHAKILEVTSVDTVNTPAASAAASTSTKSPSEQAQEEIFELQEAIRVLNERVERTQQKSKWLDGRGKSLYGNGSTTAPPLAFDASSAREWLNFFDEEAAKNDQIVREAEREIAKHRTKIAQVQRRLVSTAPPTLTVMVMLDVDAEGTVELALGYLVHDASWTAGYDLRVIRDSGDSASEDALTLTYQAVVVNSTGEDWDDIKLRLSTAKPGAGGFPPVLGTATVGLYRPHVTFSARAGVKAEYKSAHESVRRRGSVDLKEEFLAQTLNDFDDDDERESFGGEGSRLPQMAVSTSTAKTGIGSSTFECPATTTIPSDGQPHKSTIMVADLKPTFTVMASPKVSPYCFVKCSTRNTLDVPLLAGSANVFVNGGFVATTKLEGCGPGETFAVGLGVDEMVRIDYAPEKITREAASAGLLGMSGKKNILATYEYRSVIRNAKDKKISVVLYEQLPRSSTDTIKVTLRTPELTEPPPPDNAPNSAKLNAKNNLEWRFEVPAKSEKAAVFSFTIESRKEDNIQVNYS